MNQLVPFTAHSASALVAASDERATMRFRNAIRARRAYDRSVAADSTPCP
jgi:hypothetical protein